MAVAPAASSARRCENRLAAASIRSPRGERLSTRAARSAPAGRLGPKASRASPAVTRWSHRAAAGCAARNARRAGRARAARFAFVGAAAASASAERPPEHALDRDARHAAGTQQHRLAEAGDDGGLHADRRRRRRRRSGRCGRAGRRARAARWSARHGRSGWPTARPPGGRSAARMSRATGWSGTRTAMLSRPAVASSATGQSVGLRQHQRQRPRPQRRRQPLGRRVEARQPPRRRQVGNMGDQRIERGPALGVVEPRHRDAVLRVGAEAVDGLGRERDQPAGRQRSGRPPQWPRNPPS